MFLTKLLSSFFYPLPILFLLILAALCFSKRRRLFLVLALGWILLTATLMLPSSLLKRHAGGHPAVTVPRPEAVAVVVLACTAFRGDPDLPINARLSPEGLARIVEGFRLHRRLPGTPLWISVPDLDAEEAAGVMQALSELLGGSSDSVFAFTGARTTREEAQRSAAHLTPGEPFYLVTHDYHLPRALLTFQNQGLNPLPAPVIHDSLDRGPRALQSQELLPASSHMLSFRRWTHEQLGILYEHLKRK
ncbi:MAG: YdcF family protein [Verrucomicrobia bacterium]|nr:YdcF family protein [Verrucomicrobiota bacterium]